jgi:hypothetical protein
MIQTGGGTPLYMAPEMQGVIQNGTSKRSGKVTYTEAVDIWAVGVMTFQILAGRPPFRPGEIVEYTTGELCLPTRWMRQAMASDGACEFVRSLLAPLPVDRPSAKEGQQKHWLQAHTIPTKSPACSSYVEPCGDKPMEGLQEATATWASTRVSRVGVQNGTSMSDKVAAGETAPPNHTIPKAAPTVNPSILVTHVDGATNRVLGRGPKERDGLLDCPNVTNTDSAATKLVPELHSKSLDAPEISSESRKHSNQAGRHARPRAELRDSQSDKPDNSSEVEGHIHDNVHPYDVERSRTLSPSERSAKKGSRNLLERNRETARKANAVADKEKAEAEENTKSKKGGLTPTLPNPKPDPKATKRTRESRSSPKPDSPSSSRRSKEQSFEGTVGHVKDTAPPDTDKVRGRDKSSREGHTQHPKTSLDLPPQSSHGASPVRKSTDGRAKHMERSEEHPAPSLLDRSGTSQSPNNDTIKRGHAHERLRPSGHTPVSDSEASLPSHHRRTNTATRKATERKHRNAHTSPEPTSAQDGRSRSYKKDKNSLKEDTTPEAVKRSEQHDEAHGKTASSPSHTKERGRAASSRHPKTVRFASSERQPGRADSPHHSSHKREHKTTNTSPSTSSEPDLDRDNWSVKVIPPSRRRDGRAESPHSRIEHVASSEKEPGRADPPHHSTHGREHRTANTSTSTSPEPDLDRDDWSAEANPPSRRRDEAYKHAADRCRRIVRHTKYTLFPPQPRKHGRAASSRRPKPIVYRVSPFIPGISAGLLSVTRKLVYSRSRSDSNSIAGSESDYTYCTDSESGYSTGSESGYTTGSEPDITSNSTQSFDRRQLAGLAVGAWLADRRVTETEVKRMKALKDLEIPRVTTDTAHTKSLRAMRTSSPQRKHGDASMSTPRTRSGRLSPFRHGRYNDSD